MKIAPKTPVVGQLVEVHGVKCRITRIRKFGTIDVLTLDGTRAWRVTGLNFPGGK